MNVFTLLDSLLVDYASPRTRKTIHTLLALAALVTAAVLAANGDWGVAALSLLGSLYGKANADNVALTPLDSANENPDVDPEFDEADEDEFERESEALSVRSNDSSPLPDTETLYRPGEKEGERFSQD